MGSRFRIAGATWLGLLALAGCAGGIGLPGSSSGDDRSYTSAQVAAIWREETVMTVQGVLGGITGDPRDCVRLRVGETESFALIGDVGRLREGDRVEVTGPIAQWSTCSTFRVIRIDRIRPLPR